LVGLRRCTMALLLDARHVGSRSRMLAVTH
jgi:hypothetical protein